MGCDLKNTMSWFLYHILIKSIKETMKNLMWRMIIVNKLLNVYIHVLDFFNLSCQFAPAIWIPSRRRRNWYHTQTSKLNEAYLILPQNTKWFTLRGLLYLILLHIPRIYFIRVGKFLVHGQKTVYFWKLYVT